MGDERGSVTLWMLGISMLLLVFGGLGLDFWRGLALQRELAALADSAAIAAASGIDEEHYRATGEIVLSEERATELAMASITFQSADLYGALVTVAPAGSEVTVEVAGTLRLGLLGVLVDETEPLLIRASATANPELVP